MHEYHYNCGSKSAIYYYMYVQAARLMQHLIACTARGRVGVIIYTYTYPLGV